MKHLLDKFLCLSQAYLWTSFSTSSYSHSKIKIDLYSEPLYRKFDVSYNPTDSQGLMFTIRPLYFGGHVFESYGRLFCQSNFLFYILIF